MSTRKFNVAVVGLGFGAEFIPLWQKHPQCFAGSVNIVRVHIDPAELDRPAPISPFIARLRSSPTHFTKT